ncbi:hypothetical protein [Prevotella sp. P2-180]|uniref:hypothetical protein n=1 Tax=Prevotella sp. P2-180 TaxID=2024224 RepID=UPI000B970073|nr:hypothetical protein [Prevotella sp. P2-180]OYP67007.1 hypothetical protein CIK98_06310 [Prevotella sp. P2-180]
MELDNIQEINEGYLGVLTKIDLLDESWDTELLEKLIGYIEKDILEMAARYDVCADITRDEFARDKQRLLDAYLQRTNDKDIMYKVKTLKKLRERESAFAESLP